MKITKEMKEAVEQARRQHERWTEQHWQDQLFDLQMRFGLTDKQLQQLEDS